MARSPLTSHPTARPAAAPAPRRAIRLGLWGALAAYLLGLGGLAAATAAGPERWWWSTLNLYLPQWLWAVPAVLLLAAGVKFDRRLAWLAAVTLFWVGGPVMGFCWPLRPQIGATSAASRLRLMTYNVRSSASGSLVAAEVARHQPDVVAFQETARAEGALADILDGWNMTKLGRGFVASRLPLADEEVRQFLDSPPWRTYTRCRIKVGGDWVTLYNLHFLTPRDGLTALRHGAGAGIWALQDNTTTRLIQVSGVADDLAKEQGPLLVAGDFNAPVQSIVCRKLMRHGLTDAFSTAGQGYGYSFGHELRLVAHSYVRLDHILASRHWRVERCWTGGADASDHRPVIADLVLTSE